MNNVLKESVLDYFSKIEKFVEKDFEIYSISIADYGWSSDINIDVNLINNTPGSEKIHRDNARIAKPRKSQVCDDIIELLVDVFKNISFVVLPGEAHAEIINCLYAKPSISGKYKTNLRLTKPIKGITRYDQYYFFDRFNVTYAVSGIKYHKEKNIGCFKARVTNKKYDKLVRDIECKANEVLENYNNINIGDLLKFTISYNRCSMSLDNVRDENGCGVALDMLPDPTIFIKKAMECMMSNDYIYTNAHHYVNFKKIFTDEFTLKECSNYDGSVRYIKAEHKKNNIAANEIYLYKDDFSAMLEKPGIDSELEETIMSYMLLTML